MAREHKLSPLDRLYRRMQRALGRYGWRRLVVLGDTEGGAIVLLATPWGANG